jgi:hypothetical protein
MLKVATSKLSHRGTIREHVRACLEPRHSLLDMGTGGGELLASMAPLPDVWATEGYPPNVPIARLDSLLSASPLFQ